METKVGIFWVYLGELIALPVPYEAGIDDGLFVNGPAGHAEAWERLQRQNPRLLLFEYDEIPRGRVLFDKAKARYVVYLDRTLFNRTTQQAVLSAFALPEAQTVFRTDLHYTTRRQDLDRLFDDG